MGVLASLTLSIFRGQFSDKKVCCQFCDSGKIRKGTSPRCPTLPPSATTSMVLGRSQVPLLGSDGLSGSPYLHSESLRVAQPGKYLPLGYVSAAVPGDTTSLGSGYSRTALAPQSSACFTWYSRPAE